MFVLKRVPQSVTPAAVIHPSLTSPKSSLSQTSQLSAFTFLQSPMVNNKYRQVNDRNRSLSIDTKSIN